MAIFSRRTIQDKINRLKNHLDPEGLSKIVDRLNLNNRQSLAVEWELILLASLPGNGKLTYERNFGGSTNIDIAFQDNNITFICDVTTASDTGYVNDNNFEFLRDEFLDFVNKYGFNGNGFSLDVEGDLRGRHRDVKLKLRLPPKQEIKNILKGILPDFLNNIKDDPDTPKNLEIINDEIFLKISYDKKKNVFFGGGHPSYNVPYSIKRNPVYNSLKEKAKKLKNSNYQGIKGVFLCDADCQILNTKRVGSSEFSLEDIIRYFFESNSTIDFVWSFSVHEESKFLSRKKTRNIVIKTFYNRLEKSQIKCLDNIKDILEKQIPSPKRTATNAINILNSKTAYSNHFYGGFSVSASTIKISSRELLEYLSGDDKVNTFKDKLNICFQKKIQHANTIDHIEIIKSNDEDDDWVVFSFKDSDPSVNPFEI